MTEATEVFRCVGEANVLAWKPDYTQCLGEKRVEVGLSLLPYLSIYIKITTEARVKFN